MNRLLAFFNKLGKRERLGAVAIAALVVYLLMDLTLVGPLERRNKTLKSEVAKIEAELNATRAELTVVKAELEKDPYAKDRAQLEQYRRAIDEATAFIATVDTDPRQLGALLRQLIAGTPGVSLVSLKTLPPQAATEARAAPAGAAKGQQPQPQRSIYRRGIEITIRGNYLALIPYLEKVQGAQKVLWSEAELDVGTYPEATLKLSIYTLSAQPDPSLG